MKLTIFLLILISYSFIQADQPEIIYGEDSRLEVEQTSYSHLSQYMVAMVNTYNLNKVQTLKQKKNLCAGEKFASQPSISSCSGLLVKGKYIVTAAHCLGYTSDYKQFCRDKSWLMDYKTHNGQAQIDKSKLLKCRRVIEVNKTHDYAVIELSRSVRGRFFSPRLQDRLTDEPFVTLGFPSGLPLKIAEGELIKQNGGFMTKPLFNFDTFSGSSGSPVFTQSGSLVGLLKFGKQDFFLDKKRSCYTANKCNVKGLGCSVNDEDELEGEVALLFSDISKRSKLYRILTQK